MLALQLDAIGKTFAPARRVLSDITFHVAPGECLALVGPSGCGKTTLLRIIAGLEVPTTGALHMDGRPVNDVPCHQRGVAMLFQRPALMPQKTVRQNLRRAWSLREPWTLLFGTNRQREEELTRVARLLDLEQDLDRPIRQLSGGQQQRTALGRCLLRKAGLCLLDEPLGHLDAPLRTELRRQIRSLAKEFGVTTIHVTHDPEEAFSVGDRVAVMQQGTIVQLDEPAKLQRRPANRFVAELVHHGNGGVNLLAGDIRWEDMDTTFECGFGRWPIRRQILHSLRESLYFGENFHAGTGKVHIIVGIAVSDVVCSTDRTGTDDDVVLALKVREIEHAAAGTSVIAAGERGRWIGRAAPAEYFQPGQDISLSFSMARAYWFDAATDRTLVAPAG